MPGGLAPRPLRTAVALLAASLECAVLGARVDTPQTTSPRRNGTIESARVAAPRNIPYADAQPLFDELRPELLPDELRDQRPSARRSAWPRWVAAHDAQIRARLKRGYEDSIVNLLFFGTRFTALPRIRSGDIPRLSDERSDLLERRLDDLTGAIVSPGANGRLRFVRTMVERRAINPETEAGRRAARDYFSMLVTRFALDRDRYDRIYRSAKQLDDPSATLFTQSTMYRDRGLSSDTSIFPDFALDAALRDLRAERVLHARTVRRVGVIGPGLDFTDKDEGFDFYPQQTIQPFALLDSLVRLDLAAPVGLRATTFDLNPRVTEHLQAARLRAAAGEPYAVQLVRDVEEHWVDPLAAYWQRLGNAIGQEIPGVEPPANAGSVQVRAVRIPPAIMLSVTAQDLNIVLQRIEPGRMDQLDLVVATNILVYYDVFEQALALANVAKMLRPGGIFLTNHLVLSSPSMMMVGYTDVPYTGAGDGDRIWWYQKQ
jgi:hypothetical protein